MMKEYPSQILLIATILLTILLLFIYENWIIIPSIPLDDLNHSPITSARTSTKPSKDNRDKDDWKHIGTFNQVKTYTKSIPGSKLLAFRGVTVIDVHISHALGPFINITHSLEWVSMLKSIEALPITNEQHPHLYEILQRKIAEGKDKYALDDISYQTLGLPWPIQARDVLLVRQFDFNEAEKKITVQYHSIEDERKPYREDYIRAVSPHTMWRFTAVQTPTIKDYDHWKEQSMQSQQPQSQHQIFTASHRSKSVETSTSGGVVLTSLAFHKILQRIFTTFPKKLLSFCKSIFRKLTNSNTSKSNVQRNEPVGEASTSHHHRQKATDHQQEEEQLKHHKPSHHHNQPQSQSQHQHQPNKISAHRQSHSKDHFTEEVSVNTIHKITPYTLIEIETIVDSKGSIPAWFINYMQMFWPSMTLSIFRNLAKKGQMPPYEKVEDW